VPWAVFRKPLVKAPKRADDAVPGIRAFVETRLGTAEIPHGLVVRTIHQQAGECGHLAAGWLARGRTMIGMANLTRFIRHQG